MDHRLKTFAFKSLSPLPAQGGVKLCHLLQNFSENKETSTESVDYNLAENRIYPVLPDSQIVFLHFISEPVTKPDYKSFTEQEPSVGSINQRNS
ncbi:hypothetical protein [Flavobacterium silvaticum]|uniref:Uncharacterized protein n=1 Tax=Flavobacterium silvaticum TaxID=1852020 RepID=A0A972JGN3_9FLAO|nr:hypothetical protein [Flavobacterium silvaticum]NMH28376.1 hypothetical protein [Flavobacterium silvaticum]